MSAGIRFTSLFHCRHSGLEILNERSSKHLMNRFSTLSTKKVSNIYGTIPEGGEGIEEGQYAMVSYRSNWVQFI